MREPRLYALLVFTLLLNLAVLSIPFLGDELQGLMNNAVIRSPQLFFERMLSLKGFFQRPLSVFSFMLNYQLSGQNPWSYHLLNLLIHLLNVSLVYLIARQIAIAPLLATAIFALHPLAGSCVALVYGRPYSLGVLWMLLALYACLKRAGEMRPRDWLLQVLLFLAMLLSKQVFVFYPVLLLWIYYAGGIPEKSRARLPWSFVRRSFVVLLSAVFLLLLLGVTQVHILPNLVNAPVSARVFANSQLGNLAWILAGFYLLPVNGALFHELPWYEGFGLYPALGLMIFSVLIAAGLYFRRRLPAMLLICFFISYLPTNSVIPKGEVLLEWRLYPSLVFFSLFVAALYTAYARGRGRSFWNIGLAAFLLCSLCATARQNYIYQNAQRTYQELLRKYPNSAVAENGLGYQYFLEKDYESAERHLLRAHQLKPQYTRAISNCYLLYRRWGKPKKAEYFRKQMWASR